MSLIGIFTRYKGAAVQNAVEIIENWAKQNSYKLLFEKKSAALLGTKSDLTLNQLADNCDPIITLGGDGTLLRVARNIAEKDRTIVGVNLGKLGFLTEITVDEIEASLSNYISGNAVLSDRAMLKVELIRGGKTILQSRALNDIVVIKSGKSPLVDLDIVKDLDNVMRIRADGLIFATPTGSTAYSLAAGGSLVYPSLSVLLLTPICPHSLTNRPLILPLESKYFVRIPEFDGELVASMDGQEDADLKAGDQIVISKARVSVRFLRASDKNYFDILRSKLNWAVNNNLNLERGLSKD